MDPSLYNWLGSVYPIYTGVADAVDERFVHGRVHESYTLPTELIGLYRNWLID